MSERSRVAGSRVVVGVVFVALFVVPLAAAMQLGGSGAGLSVGSQQGGSETLAASSALGGAAASVATAVPCIAVNTVNGVVYVCGDPLPAGPALAQAASGAWSGVGSAGTSVPNVACGVV